MRRRRVRRTDRLAMAVVACACACAAWAWPYGAVAQSVPALAKLETWQLDNGMRVSFLPISSTPVVAVELWYHVGAKDEPGDHRGIARVFERIMFQGSERVPPEAHTRHINRLGGYTSATTTEDATRYSNVLPKDYLDLACELEAQRMRSLLFRPKMIATEVDTVRMATRRQEGDPLARGFLRLQGAAYGEHAYAWTTDAVAKGLDATTPADLQRFYDTFYTPQNAMLVVVGDVSADQVRAAADRWFGSIPGGDAPPRPAAAIQEPTQRRETTSPGQIGLILGGFLIPEATHADVIPLQVASAILGAGESSRLNRRLVRGDGDAVQTGAPILVREHRGLLTFFAALVDGQKSAAVEAALVDEVNKLQTAPVSARELTRAKNQLQAAFVFSVESAAGVAEQIGTSWVNTGDPKAWLSAAEKVGKVTAADVQRVARTYLTPEKSIVVITPPTGGNR